MPAHAGNPSQLSKHQLKSLLISHNVPLPRGDPKKQVYLQLYLKHVLTQNKEAADFSSEDEDLLSENDVLSLEVEEETREGMMDVRSLSNSELKEQLLKRGVRPGPILPSTRSVYERKLQQLLEEGPAQVRENGAGDVDQYSDSEDEGFHLQKRVEMKSESPLRAAMNGVSSYSAANIPSSLAAEYNQNLATLGDDFSVSKILKQPEDPTRLDDFSEPMSLSPLGLSATRRKPIKGAAGRPIQFKYDDLATRARMQEQKGAAAEKGARRLVPVALQIVVFVVVAFFALVFLTMETNPENPFLPPAESAPDVQQP